MDQETKIKETIKQQQQAEAVGKFAASLALPGPLADVFAPQPAITVGKYSVRPFYDADFEYLQLLKHPFAAFAVGRTDELESFVPRGPEAWQLFWIMTNPVETVDAEFANHGEAGVKAAAKQEFGSYQLGALFALYKAVVQQLTVYASSVVGYGPAEASGEGEEAAKGQLPPVWSAVDGLGWLVDKRARLMKTYGWSYRHVRLELTGAQGWVWYNWALENAETGMGPAYKRTTDGYIARQRNGFLK